MGKTQWAENDKKVYINIINVYSYDCLVHVGSGQKTDKNHGTIISRNSEPFFVVVKSIHSKIM